MDYAEFIERVLHGRSVNSVAKCLGIPQKTFDRYTKAQTLPEYDVALTLAHEAGIDEAEAFRILATEAAKKKGRSVMSGLLSTTGGKGRIRTHVTEEP